MNLKQPTIFIKIPTTQHTTRSIRVKDIIYLTDTIDRTSVVHSTGGHETEVFYTDLKAHEIEEGMQAIVQQQEQYDEQIFGIKFLGEDDA